jgi:hypothetical protein
MSKNDRTISTTAYVGDVDVDVELSDIMFELEDDELIEELKDRGYTTLNTNYSNVEDDQLRRVLCDIVEVNYHTDKTKIIELLIQKFK